jgi:hypothetical protein
VLPISASISINMLSSLPPALAHKQEILLSFHI